jgi:hypothetical protein
MNRTGKGSSIIWSIGIFSKVITKLVKENAEGADVVTQISLFVFVR